MPKTPKPVLDRSTCRYKLDLSPSINHRRVMDGLKPELAFAGGPVKPWQKKLRAKLVELTGFDRMPAAGRRAPLRVRSLWRRETALGSIEKLAFTAEAGSDALAYLCLPRGVKPPYTAFVCVQGHSTGAHNSIAVAREDNRKAITVEGDRDFGLGCLRRGLAALCIEQRSFGERREQTQAQVLAHGCHDATMQALLLGRTLIGERVFDVDRGIDYLAQRGDIDMARIGVMGNSGGGTVALFAAALLSPVALAMPSCYFCTFRDSIMAIGHCMDNYIPGLLRYAEMADVMGLFAPRPVVVVAGKTDPIFPIAGVRRAFQQLQRIYTAAGAAQNCRLVVGPEGHRFYAELAWPKMQAFL
ncbi:MAG: alpha/beta hydrolase family protein [Planctomycetota bacterium]